jgi:uncharacterized protein
VCIHWRPYFYTYKFTTVKKLLFLLLFSPLLVTSQIPEPEKGTYVNDQYGYLKDNEKSVINKQLRYIEDSTGVQVAVVIIPAIPEKYSIEDYAREIGRKWHVGNAKNGLVYVAAIDQRQQRLEVASHLEGTITDATAARLVAGVKPYFRNHKYGEGIINMILGLQIRLLEVKKEQLQLTADELKKKKEQSGPFWLWVLLWPICFGVPSFVIFRIIRKRREERRRKEHEALILRTNKQLEIKRKSQEMDNNNLKKHIDQKYARPTTRTNTISDDPALIVPPEIYTPPSKSYDEDDYTPKSSGYSSGSSDSGSSSSSSSDYGNWGSGSCDSGSSSSDSGYSGGGASDTW